jgi:acyl-CoA reductase-like NAD-dependent aldehyde dehydrogenase
MSTTLDLGLEPLHIAGERVESSEGLTFETLDPTTGQAIARVSEASAADLDRAVAAARKAFDGPLAKMGASRRAKALRRVAELLRERIADLAKLETRNAGKPISWSHGEIQHAAEVFEYYAAAALVLAGQAMPVGSSMLHYTLREPIGVCAQIIPWNFPLVMAAWKLAPALAAGNAVILKPAEQTPLTALLLADICLEAGFPSGAVNVLNGRGETVGAMLVDHPGIDKVAFTGSTEVGKRVMAQAARTLKRVTLELGGKSPNVVFEDAHLQAAVEGALFGIYDNAGQCCNARSRILVHASLHDAFVERFIEKARKIRQGDVYDPRTQMGALISKEQWDRVDGYVKLGQEEGASLKLGGGRPEGLADGYYYAPTVLDGVTNAMRVAREEIFGPVVVIETFQTEAEALQLANDTPYGLFATVYTQDVARAHRVAGRIRAGGVTINTPGGTFPGVPFGGYKQSGFGRELSLEAMHQYTEEKAVLVHTSERSANFFGV